MTPRRELKAPVINGVVIHPAVTIERIIDGVHRQMETLDDPGFCIACGEEAESCEPDARMHRCEHCDEKAVYGAEELLIYLG